MRILCASRHPGSWPSAVRTPTRTTSALLSPNETRSPPRQTLDLRPISWWEAWRLISFRGFVLGSGPFRPRKNIRFIAARVERREALSIPGAQRSRNGRGREHSAQLGYAPRRTAQAGLTEGAERSSKLRHETNVVGRPAGRLDLELGISGN